MQARGQPWLALEAQQADGQAQHAQAASLGGLSAQAGCSRKRLQKGNGAGLHLREAGVGVLIQLRLFPRVVQHGEGASCSQCRLLSAAGPGIIIQASLSQQTAPHVVQHGKGTPCSCPPAAGVTPCQLLTLAVGCTFACLCRPARKRAPCSQCDLAAAAGPGDGLLPTRALVCVCTLRPRPVAVDAQGRQAVHATASGAAD